MTEADHARFDRSFGLALKIHADALQGKKKKKNKSKKTEKVQEASTPGGAASPRQVGRERALL